MCIGEILDFTKIDLVLKKAVVFDMGSVVDAENSDTTWVDTACQGLAN